MTCGTSEIAGFLTVDETLADTFFVPDLGAFREVFLELVAKDRTLQHSGLGPVDQSPNKWLAPALH